MSSPSLTGQPGHDDPAEAGPKLLLGRRPLGDPQQVLGQDLVEDLARREGEQDPAEGAATSGDIAPVSRVTRSASSDSTWWRQTDDSPIRRTTIAVSPVSWTSIRNGPSAWRMRRSLLTIKPVPMRSFGPSRKTPPCRSTNPKSPSVRR